MPCCLGYRGNPLLIGSSNVVKKQLEMKEFIGGSVAACCAVTFTNPWDVVKTQLQLYGQLTRMVEKPKLSSLFMNLWSKEGVRGIQRGLLSAYWYQMSMNGVRFMTYDFLKKKTTNTIGIKYIENAFCGGISGALGAFVGTPFNLIKTRIQSLKYNYTGTLHGMSQVVKYEGFNGLYRGVHAAMLRTGIGSSLQLSTYDLVKGILIDRFKLRSDSIVTHFMTSLISGFITCVGMNPPDVINTRLYNQQNGSQMYKGIADCFAKTIRKEGIMALYKGFWPLYIRTGPHTVLTFIFLEQIRIILSSH